MHFPSSRRNPRLYAFLHIFAPTFFVIFLVIWWYGTKEGTDSRASKMADSGYFKYDVVKGYFMQSEDETDDKKFDFRKQNFGLIDREYGTEQTSEEVGKQHWRSFERYVRGLNEKKGEKEKGISYKVLFLGRHGQGWHNVAETKYGTEHWDCYYSLLDGSDGITWSDALLTSLGKEQALDVNKVWKALLPKGIPAPETYYVSPLTRALETADLSFTGLELPHDRPYAPVGKELLREALGVHTCDRRSPASHIRSAFPHVAFEPGFSEPDPLWEADYREPRSARRYRLAQFLDDVFGNDGGAFLSFTSHSGAIASILEEIGHREFALQTGGVIPVFVKAQRMEGKRHKPPKEPSEAPPACEKPPGGLGRS